MAIPRRRALTRTHAPILSSFRRALPQAAAAGRAPARPRRRTAPALACAPHEAPEAPPRLSGAPALRPGAGRFVRNLRLRAFVPGQTQQIIHLVGLAPAHRRIARETRIGPQQNPHIRPARPQPGHNPRRLFHSPGRAVDIRRPQFRRRKMTTAENIKRQIATAVAIAVEKPPFLRPVNRIVRRVQIQDNPLRSLLVRPHEQRHKQTLNRRTIMRNLAAPGRTHTPRLKPVPRRLPRNRRAIRTLRTQLPRQNRHDRVVAQRIAIDRVLVSRRNPEHPLPHKRPDIVLHKATVATILEAGRKTIHRTRRRVRPAEKQRARVRGRRTAVELRNDLASRNRLESPARRATLRPPRGTPPPGYKSLIKNTISKAEPRCTQKL